MNKKGFTIIELIVIMAVIGILVLLAMPKFMGNTKQAKITKMVSGIKVVEDASERYYIDDNDWPITNNIPYTEEQLSEISGKVYDKTGHQVILDPAGKYYNIDDEKLIKNVNIPDPTERYIIKNPEGIVYAILDDLIPNDTTKQEDTIGNLNNTYGLLFANSDTDLIFLNNNWLDRYNYETNTITSKRTFYTDIINGSIQNAGTFDSQVMPAYKVGSDIYYGSYSSIDVTNIDNPTKWNDYSQEVSTPTGYETQTTPDVLRQGTLGGMVQGFVVNGNSIYYGYSDNFIHKCDLQGNNDTQVSNNRFLSDMGNGEYSFSTDSETNVASTTDFIAYTALPNTSTEYYGIPSVYKGKTYVAISDGGWAYQTIRSYDAGFTNPKDIVVSDSITSYNIINDTIYYFDNLVLKSAKIDGSTPTGVVIRDCSSDGSNGTLWTGISLYKDNIIYKMTNSNGNDDIYMVKNDGTLVTTISDSIY